jgi:kynurenine 3-monooxygenase
MFPSFLFISFLSITYYSTPQSHHFNNFLNLTFSFSGFLGTVYASPWVMGDTIALIGDAAHAITPFFGQGCNSGFEDVQELYHLLAEQPRENVNMQSVFSDYFTRRKPNGDAIAKMAIENFVEMMVKTADKQFLLQKAIEIELSNHFPEQFASRYVLVTHSLIPYSICLQIGIIQQQIIQQLSLNVTTPQDIDLTLAKHLIETHLTPFLAKNGITAKAFNYVSKYYPSPQKSNL